MPIDFVLHHNLIEVSWFRYQTWGIFLGRVAVVTSSTPEVRRKRLVPLAEPQINKTISWWSLAARTKQSLRNPPNTVFPEKLLRGSCDHVCFYRCAPDGFCFDNPCIGDTVVTPSISWFVLGSPTNRRTIVGPPQKLETKMKNSTTIQ